MKLIIITVFCCVFKSVISNDLYSVNVLSYNDATFREEVPQKPHFVKFFAPWCGHCKRLAPTWDELAEKHNKKSEDVLIAKVDCTIDTALCAEQGITGYPTLKFFKVGTNEGQKYRGPRDLASLDAFVAESLGKQEIANDEPIEIPKPKQGLIELTDETFAKVTAHGQHFVKFYAPWCGHCQKLAPIWDDLAKSFEHDPAVKISKIDCTTHRDSCVEFEVKAYPTLLWIVDGKKLDRYQDGRSHEELKDYVEKMREFIDDNKKSEDGRVKEEPEPEGTPVVELTTDNFDSAIETGISFVKFFAPWCGHCRRLAPTWDELGKKFIGKTNIKIAKVDCTVQEELCERLKIEGYPTLVLFENGKKVDEYQGARELEGMYNFVNDHKVHDEL